MVIHLTANGHIFSPPARRLAGVTEGTEGFFILSAETVRKDKTHSLRVNFLFFHPSINFTSEVSFIFDNASYITAAFCASAAQHQHAGLDFAGQVSDGRRFLTMSTPDIV
jgi:hypothetical protein